MNEMAGPAQRRRTPWRFSLRELLLAMTAVAALLALAVKSYPSPPTTFFRQFDSQASLQTLCNDLGIDMPSVRMSAGSSLGPGGGRRHWHVWSCQKQHPFAEISLEFAKRVKAEIVRHGCKITGSSLGSTSFGYSYQRGGTKGEFVADFVDLHDGNFALHAFCFEVTKR
jgi:hypothetical protein